MEKIEPKQEPFPFVTMDNDELLAWWLFYKMDNGDVHVPPRMIAVIKDYRKLTRNGVIETLEREYN